MTSWLDTQTVYRPLGNSKNALHFLVLCFVCTIFVPNFKIML